MSGDAAGHAESDPLLPGAAAMAGGEEGDAGPVGMWDEVRALAGVAWPVSVASSCSMALPIINTAFIGHLGTNELAAASLAVTLFNVVQQVPLGATLSLNTLVSQANGAGNKALQGTWLRVSLVVVTVLCLPAVGVLMAVEPVLEPIIHEPRVSQLAGVYGRYFAISVWPTLAYSALQQFFQAQEVTWPATVASVLSLGTNVLFNQLLIYGAGSWRGLGFVGSPLASDASVCLQLLLFVAIACWWKGYHRPTWRRWSLDWASHKLQRRFWRMTLPLSVANVAEESCFQLIVIMGGRLGPAPTAANGILTMVWSLAWGIWWGIGLATQVRVGTHLGANNPAAAKQSAAVGMVLTLLTSAVVGALLVLLGKEIALVFSKDPDVHQQVLDNVKWLAVAFGSSIVTLNLSAIIEGVGETAAMSFITIVCCWGIMLPAAYALAFGAGLGVGGLWIGPAIGELFNILGFLTIIYHFDWPKLAEEAAAEAAEEAAAEAEAAVAEGTEGGREAELQVLLAPPASAWSINRAAPT